ncbi:MAG: RNase adapter RapZ [Candidatus Marinimicrobia bacterium]|nr:RNase adapter RapZ [Candidatus Neomarinimicrobiota bacterium]
MPDDTSGHGGGFVFDCRGILNPGRYEKYRDLTGNDRAVREFLEHRTGIGTFIHHAVAMVEPTVNNYVERKFPHLMVSFGCTGGQHRSVYCASKFAEYFSKRDDIVVILNHY